MLLLYLESPTSVLVLLPYLLKDSRAAPDFHKLIYPIPVRHNNCLLLIYDSHKIHRIWQVTFGEVLFWQFANSISITNLTQCMRAYGSIQSRAISPNLLLAIVTCYMV